MNFTSGLKVSVIDHDIGMNKLTIHDPLKFYFSTYSVIPIQPHIIYISLLATRTNVL